MAGRFWDNPAAARARVALCYLWGHWRLPALDNPTRFTELVQWRKLQVSDSRYPALMDKLAAKQMALDALGREWIIPTAWSGMELPANIPFYCPAIVKARHGCNQNHVVHQVPSAQEWNRLRELGRKWCRQPYGLWLDETAYRSVPRGIVAEPLVGDGEALPVDYKIYVFGGRATHIQTHLDRASNHRWMLHDTNWKQLTPCLDMPPPPRSLQAMLEAAETLAAEHDFLRVDFYEIGGQPLFGEFCLYPGSGLDPFAADWIDLELGQLWQDALRSDRYIEDASPDAPAFAGGLAS